MKKHLWIALLAAAVYAAPMAGHAHCYDSDDSDYPLRYVAYALHPLGWAVEHAILRPIHTFISATPRRQEIFGHQSWPNECGDMRHSVEVKVAQGASNSMIPTDQTGGPGDQAGGGATPVSDDHAKIGGINPLGDMQTIYFDYNKSSLRKDQVARAEADLAFLKAHPELPIMIVGHCDERGTTEYNLALGERRARSVHDYFVKNGVDPKRLMIVSKGSEEPADAGHDENAWGKNRRTEFKEPIKDGAAK